MFNWRKAQAVFNWRKAQSGAQRRNRYAPVATSVSLAVQMYTIERSNPQIVRAMLVGGGRSHY